MERKKAVHKKIVSKDVRKYYRWARRYLFRVRSAEKECGGEITAC